MISINYILVIIIIIAIAVTKTFFKKKVPEEKPRIYGKIRNAQYKNIGNDSIYVGGNPLFIDKLPEDFIRDPSIDKFIEDVSNHKKKWNKYLFSISKGFYIDEYKVKDNIILMFFDDWKLSDNFTLTADGTNYYVPEKDSILIFKKDDVISSTTFESQEKFSFILLY